MTTVHRVQDLYAGGPGDPFHVPDPVEAARARFHALLLEPRPVVAWQPGPAFTWGRRRAARLLRALGRRRAPAAIPSPFEGWVEGRLVFDPEALTLVELLYRDYRALMTAAGRAPWPRRRFVDLLDDHGVGRAEGVDGPLMRLGVRLAGRRP